MPSGNWAVVRLQVPLALALAVPITVVPSNTLMVLPASAVPLNVNCLALVTLSPAVPVSGVSAAIVGDAGATVSEGSTGGEDPSNGGGKSAWNAAVLRE